MEIQDPRRLIQSKRKGKSNEKRAKSTLRVTKKREKNKLNERIKNPQGEQIIKERWPGKQKSRMK